MIQPQEFFDLLYRPEPPRELVQLLRQWQALPHQWLEVAYISAHVALVEVEEESDQRERHVQPIVDEEHQESVAEWELELPSSAYLPRSVLPGESLPLRLSVAWPDLLIKG